MYLQHVQLAIPAASESVARRFWVDVLGFEEVPKPEPMAGRGGLWVRRDAVEIHLGVEDPFRPARKAHPALAVDDFEATLARLAAAGHDAQPDHAFSGMRRAHTSDPFGNRIEILDAAGRVASPNSPTTE